jgi:hypothetical protein
MENQVPKLVATPSTIGIQKLYDQNINMISAINQPLVLITHETQSLENLEAYNAIQNKHL